MPAVLPRRAPVSGRGHAVVIGGGMAGVLAAWPLRGYAEIITVIERDTYPAEPAFRPGMPQARHAHIFLEGGHRALEGLMPGIRAQLEVAGATEVRMSRELRWLASHGWLADHDTALTGLSATRPLLDHVVRARVAGEASVRFLAGHDVIGLLGSRSSVSGVRLRPRGEGAVTTELSAELVVDASGRRSMLPAWLAELGCPRIRETRIDAGIAYSSRLFHRPAGDFEWRAVYLQAHAPDQPTTGALMPVEGNRWLVSLGGMRGAEPRQGTEGFNELLARLRDPILRDALADAEPAGRVSGFRPGSSVRRHYTSAATPDGVVALGDAATAFNPVYAQGLTAAVLAAQALRRAVLRHRGIEYAVARAARRDIAVATRIAWLLSTGEDARFPATIGAHPGLLTRAQHRLLDRVLQRATTDATVTAAAQQVISMAASPAALLQPAVLGALLRPEH
ncbi:FAD-dependent oxidoreductase [Nocardia sp. NPDC057227]|uniref:FAD-dependent oxidoreductase n=1 Tax=Nocardia sp. NPDC057227 TaxID=3346056 RepID=UPI0036420F3D